MVSDEISNLIFHDSFDNETTFITCIEIACQSLQ